eukprot:scaffold48661_cov32-Prasinocladus_malaysianus.AAC.1
MVLWCQKDSLLLQQARLETEQRVREYEARIDGMQRHIRDVTDRSSKMRTQFEKYGLPDGYNNMDKSTLTKKCDRLALKLEDQEQNHKAEMQEVLQGFEQDRQQLQELLSRTQEVQVCLRSKCVGVSVPAGALCISSEHFCVPRVQCMSHLFGGAEPDGGAAPGSTEGAGEQANGGAGRPPGEAP